jgi:hypothetical protein
MVAKRCVSRQSFRSSSLWLSLCSGRRRPSARGKGRDQTSAAERTTMHRLAQARCVGGRRLPALATRQPFVAPPCPPPLRAYSAGVGPFQASGIQLLPRWNNKATRAPEESVPEENEESEPAEGERGEEDGVANEEDRGVRNRRDRSDRSSGASASSREAQGSSSSSGSSGSSGPSDSPPPPPSQPSSGGQTTSISKPSVPEHYPQVLALPITRRPLFPGFYKAVVIRNPAVVAAIKEMMKRGQPYLGAFLLKEEDADSDMWVPLSEYNVPGIRARLTLAGHL